MVKSATVYSRGYAMTPIVHNEILSIHENVAGDAKKTRTMPMYLPNSKGVIVLKEVPIITGNSKRGIKRRLLIDHSFDILEIDLGEIFERKEDARRVMYFFRNGGLTPKGSKPIKAHIGVYESTIAAIPFLQMLGGVYQGHHFEGSASIGIEIPMTKETFSALGNSIARKHMEELQFIDLPEVDTLNIAGAMRYTRRASVREEGGDKEAMIYGTEVIPAGTYFYSWSSVVSPYEGAILAFRAANYLMKEHGLVGGMSGRGHGRMQYDLIYCDEEGERELTTKDYTEYADYLKAHKDEIIEAIRSIPKNFQQSNGETKEEGTVDKAENVQKGKKA